MKSIKSSLELLEKLTNQKIVDKTGEYPLKEKRDTKCLKYPERTLTDNDEWFIYVPSCFNACLDIAKTDRVDRKTKEKKKVWTQGSRFAFHRGCTLYDTPKAYRKWSDAINTIKYCILIHHGTDAEPAMKEKKRNSGTVEFSIFSPSQKMKLKKNGTFTLTQDEFISFLIKGNPEIISK